jgi:hypothetical protein
MAGIKRVKNNVGLALQNPTLESIFPQFNQIVNMWVSI